VPSFVKISCHSTYKIVLSFMGGFVRLTPQGSAPDPTRGIALRSPTYRLTFSCST